MFCIRFLVFAQEEQAINEEQIALIAYVIFAVLLLVCHINKYNLKCALVTDQTGRHKCHISSSIPCPNNSFRIRVLYLFNNRVAQ